MTKSLSLIALGFAACFFLISGLTIFRETWSSMTEVGAHADIYARRRMSAEEVQTHNRVRELYRNRDVEALNEIVQVETNEIVFEVVPAAPQFLNTQSPMAELTIRNISRRKLTVYEPKIMNLSSEPHMYKGFITRDYAVVCPVSRARW